MKKFLIIMICVFTIFITGCGKKEEQKEHVPSNDGYIIYYKIAANNGPDDYYDFIYVTSEKQIVSGNSRDDGFKTKTLSKEEYNEIIDYAFSSEFTSLDKDVSDPMLMDGLNSRITLYYDDGTTFEVGGNNPINDVYLKLVNLLNKYM